MLYCVHLKKLKVAFTSISTAKKAMLDDSKIIVNKC